MIARQRKNVARGETKEQQGRAKKTSRKGEKERKRSIWYITNEAKSKQIGKKDITKKGRKKEREKMTSQNDVKTHSTKYPKKTRAK